MMEDPCQPYNHENMVSELQSIYFRSIKDYMEAIFEQSTDQADFNNHFTEFKMTRYVIESAKEALEDMRVFYLQKFFARNFASKLSQYLKTEITEEDNRKIDSFASNDKNIY